MFPGDSCRKVEFDLTDLNDETMENLTHLKRDVLRGNLKELLEDASEFFFMNKKPFIINWIDPTINQSIRMM